MSGSLLIVDDDATIRETLADFFEGLGWVVRAAATGTDARTAAATHAPDVALVDVRLPDGDGVQLLEALRAEDPMVGVVMLTGHADVRTAVRAMQRGATDFLEKPLDLEALRAVVDRAAEEGRLRREVAMRRARDQEEAGRWQRPTLDELIDLAARNSDVPVLIVGETGTGKGVAARRIHDRSPQRDAPFVEINCASLNATFFESELFGHERGAFTDARQAKRGLLEVAGTGTVFLDEIGEMPLDAQPRLLKVLEERTFRRLGGTTTLRTSARIIAATNQPLAQRVRSGAFRADLFYRLQVLTIEIPALRERPEEIPHLARQLLPAGATLSTAASRALEAYAWPGNVRELRNALWRASLVAGGRAIEPGDLGLGGSPVPARGEDAGVLSLDEAERRAIHRALEETGGNKARAAVLLGISRSTLFEKLRRESEAAAPEQS